MATSVISKYGQPLTEREVQVLQYTAQGLSNLQIGNRMNLTEHTVKTYMRRALRKLGASNRTHAVCLAAQRYLVDVDDVRPIRLARRKA